MSGPEILAPAMGTQKILQSLVPRPKPTNHLDSLDLAHPEDDMKMP